MASSIHGVPRATHDVDILADVQVSDAERLVTEVGHEFMVDVDYVKNCITHRRPFNLIHIKSAYKVDIFPHKGDLFTSAQLDRGVRSIIGQSPDESAYVATPEDIILAKLKWYTEGGMVSDRQWNDICGVITVQDERLDTEYLRKWASALGVSELLERALQAGRGA